jgi:hypothetical protein
MSMASQIAATSLGDQLISSVGTLSDAMARLRARGGFGLTSLPHSHATRRPELAVDADGAFDSEILLPSPAGTGATMRLMPPGGLEAAAVKPGKLLDLIQHPPEIDLRDAYDPGTSSLAELDEKRRELKYRKDWLEALLAVTLDEMEAFDEARKQRIQKDGLVDLPAVTPPESLRPTHPPVGDEDPIQE